PGYSPGLVSHYLGFLYLLVEDCDLLGRPLYLGLSLLQRASGLLLAGHHLGVIKDCYHLPGLDRITLANCYLTNAPSHLGRDSRVIAFYPAADLEDVSGYRGRLQEKHPHQRRTSQQDRNHENQSNLLHPPSITHHSHQIARASIPLRLWNRSGRNLGRPENGRPYVFPCCSP